MNNYSEPWVDPKWILDSLAHPSVRDALTQVRTSDILVFPTEELGNTGATKQSRADRERTRLRDKQSWIREKQRILADRRNARLHDRRKRKKPSWRQILLWKASYDALREADIDVDAAAKEIER